jgi:hypothetical protein
MPYLCRGFRNGVLRSGSEGEVRSFELPTALFGDGVTAGNPLLAWGAPREAMRMCWRIDGYCG